MAREEGAVVLLVAVMMAVFLMILALVADLAMLRMDRRTDRLAADAAVTAGVAGLDPFRGSDAATACSRSCNPFPMVTPSWRAKR